MAVSVARIFRPNLPPPGAFANRTSFSYDRPSDTLMVHLFGEARPAVSIDAGPHLYLRVDAETEDLVGLQVEHFLSRVVREQPDLLDLADLAGVPAEEIAAIRRSLPPRERGQAAVAAILRLLPTLAYPAAEDEHLADTVSAISAMGT